MTASKRQKKEDDSALCAEIVGMLEIKVRLVDGFVDDDRRQRWIASALEVLLRAELQRLTI